MANDTSSSPSSAPETVEGIFEDYSARRLGLIRALTQDVDKFFESCDPDKENLCLFGYPDESWKVSLPSDLVPSGIPEPSLGINFARDGGDRKEWIYLVAVHSNSWLFAVAFYHGGCAGLNSVERNRLFTLINNLPGVHEVVKDWQPAKDKPKKDQSGEASRSTSRSRIKRSNDGDTKSTEKLVEESQMQDEDHGDSHCGSCGLVHNGDEFWIACDVCQLWYHGMCVGITPTMAETVGNSRSSSPATVEEIFQDYKARRIGLILALTHDVDEFFESCDPDKADLCLFGYPNESWEVTVPSETVPSEIPEPTTGINFARDGSDRRDWVYMVAVHSDSWLMAVAFYHAGCAGLNSVKRNRLFTLINDLPDVYEVVRDWQPAKGKLKKDQSNEASRSKFRSGVKRSSAGHTKSTQKIVEERHMQQDEEHGETHCGSCGFVYNGDEFWIACDFCRLWYHGKCVGITPTKAETIGKYRCPYCHKRQMRL
ncbi:hypothetical protein SSX86_013055 [Deinandra increscens subsp. villosa]|uniref:PHD finger protein ALFIN-LIKE n=1 Tax=Deinandra increscens subsp. villosa TaxID=3103831 RepID=A0AAP0H1F9_9ASTR